MQARSRAAQYEQLRADGPGPDRRACVADRTAEHINGQNRRPSNSSLIENKDTYQRGLCLFREGDEQRKQVLVWVSSSAAAGGKTSIDVSREVLKAVFPLWKPIHFWCCRKATVITRSGR